MAEDEEEEEAAAAFGVMVTEVCAVAGHHETHLRHKNDVARPLGDQKASSSMSSKREYSPKSYMQGETRSP